MYPARILFVLLCCFALPARAQGNFTYTPEKPQAGDQVTITYVPEGDLKGTRTMPDAAVFQVGADMEATDIRLTEKNGKLTGTFRADTAVRFLYFVFSVGEKVDNNFNKGYTILLYQGDKPAKGSYAKRGLFYSGDAAFANVDIDLATAVGDYDKEFAAYPDSWKEDRYAYFRALLSTTDQDGKTRLGKEIERMEQDGLKDEDDYAALGSMYELLKQGDKAAAIAQEKRKQFPNGKWLALKADEDFEKEQDPVNKRKLLDSIIRKTQTDPGWANLKRSITAYKKNIARIYAQKEDWEGFQKVIKELDITDKRQLAELYNDLAWSMQEKGTHLDYAAEFAQTAMELIRAEWRKPVAKPKWYGSKQWETGNKYLYSSFADTYAMILFKTKQYDRGLLFAHDAAIVINKGDNTGMNDTYALLAEKGMPAKAARIQLEHFVKRGKSTAVVADALKKVYIKEQGSDAGFEAYRKNIEEEGIASVKEALRKMMITEAAPQFSLVDLDGKTVDIAKLKGKIVVLDFWATWCGPCKASFPGMQKAQEKFKGDPDVVFLFVNTREYVNDVPKVVTNFIRKKQYPFRVLLDMDKKVVAQYHVGGIPAKFVIDKKGNIRFKSEGFNNEEELIRELTAMIELAKT